MTITIRIPAALRSYTEGKNIIHTTAATVSEALANLEKAHPRIHQHLRDEHGNLRGFINVYKGEEDIRHLQGEASLLNDNEEITIVPAIAGGLS
jgi:molybdopterin synthase sulfur carrier subunit